MCDKIKIQSNTGDWKCPKCGCLNTELKENVKKISRTLCRSCFFEFDIDKDENQKNKVIIERNSCSNMITVKMNGDESVWVLDDGVATIASDIHDLLKYLGIESEIY